MGVLVGCSALSPRHYIKPTNKAPISRDHVCSWFHRSSRGILISNIDYRYLRRPVIDGCYCLIHPRIFYRQQHPKDGDGNARESFAAVDY